MRGLRTNRWKYIRNFETGLGVEIPSDIAGSGAYRDLAGRMDPSHHVEVELYDLHADPNEQTNLAGNPQNRRHPGRTRRPGSSTGCAPPAIPCWTARCNPPSTAKPCGRSLAFLRRDLA